MVRIKEGRNNNIAMTIIRETPGRIETGIRVGLRLIGQRLVRTSRSGILNPPKSGEIYKYKGRRHKSSAPGQYPANRSGKLRKSVDFIVEGSRRMRFGTPSDRWQSVRYGEFLETGTRKMRPRPFLKPSIHENKDYSKRTLYKTVNAELKRRG